MGKSENQSVSGLTTCLTSPLHRVVSPENFGSLAENFRFGYSLHVTYGDSHTGKQMSTQELLSGRMDS